jgi:hypothetical protein
MLLDYFTQVKIKDRTLSEYLRGETLAEDLDTIKEVLDYVHMSHVLLRPYSSDYPIIEPNELLPSFDDNLVEYPRLPSFSLLVLDRLLDYQSEIFQFDLLEPLDQEETGRSTTVRSSTSDSNHTTFKSRLTREYHLDFETRLENKDLTALSNYPAVLEFLFHMDRAHVIGRNEDNVYRFLGLFASFPSNLDWEIKNFGHQIGKFMARDNESYRENRLMVYRFLMELYGFPISSERRTSAALFARELCRRKERFLIKVHGHSDRVLTTLYHPNVSNPYPQVEKVALVPLNITSQDLVVQLEQEGYFVDPERQVVLLRATYQQHRYNEHNVNEERALSLVNQEIIHPRTGERFPWLNVLQAREDRLLNLNDIVRGEYSGSIVYQGQEIIDGTTKHEDRLKFLSAWLRKHQRRFVSVSPAFLEKVEGVIDSYILNPSMAKHFRSNRVIHRNILEQMAYIRQANTVHRLELIIRAKKNVRYLDLIDVLIEFLNENKKQIVDYYEPVFEKLIFFCDEVLTDKYLLKTYVNNSSNSKYGREVVTRYKKLDSIKKKLEKQFRFNTKP